MRIEKPANGLYQAKLAQDQIEVVSSDLVSSTGALNSQITIVNNNLIAASSTLDAKIDSSLTKFKVRSLNAFNQTPFETTSTSTVYVTNSATIINKNHSDTELRVGVFISAEIDTSTTGQGSMLELSYSTNLGVTWAGTTTLNGRYNSTSLLNVYLVYFNLGQITSGDVNFRIGVKKLFGQELRIRNFSYQFIEAMENA